MTSLTAKNQSCKENILDKYQQIVKDTHIHQFHDFNLLYFSNGLGGECGEVQNEIKKLYREMIKDNESVNVSEIKKRKENIKTELGDVMWYLTAIVNDLGFSLDDILKGSIKKCHTFTDWKKNHSN